jgi:hypothetical protein
MGFHRYKNRKNDRNLRRQHGREKRRRGFVDFQSQILLYFGGLAEI